MARRPPGADEGETAVEATATADGAASRSAGTLRAGATLGRYVIIERLGAGGMGEVHAAYDFTLDRKVALKLLRRNDQRSQPLLLREAHAMARLSHPNVVTVFDAGIVGDRLFVAMELVEGRTLRAWQREAKRSAREVLRVYVAAGRGLEAAHAAGLVHRDFKPSNVLVSLRGEVKVTDFGVARPLPEPASASIADESGSRLRVRERDPSLSIDGAVVGTPGYMSPEQCRGAVVDARSDQFSFCVALFEALHGERPFPEETPAARLSAIEAGRLRETKSDGVPSHVARALARGLSYQRDARYPSMGALLDDLLRSSARRTHRWMALGIAVSAVVSFAAWSRHEASARRAMLCSGGDAEAGETWNDATRADVERALLATDVPYAADTSRRVREHIDGYVKAWTAAQRGTCEATRVRGEQSEKVMGLRMACLERRRDEVRALARVLASADREIATNAVEASLSLTNLSVCTDTAALEAADVEPADPAHRGELSSIWAGLAQVKANLDAGKPRVAGEEVAPLVERAGALGDEPALAQALLLSSAAKADAATWGEAVEDARLALLAADRGGDDARRAMAETALVHWLTETGRLDDAEEWSHVAEATLRRTHGEGEAWAEWLDASGWLLHRQGRNEEAESRLRAGLEAAKRSGVAPYRVSKVARALAEDEAALGAYGEAERLVDEADSVLIAAVGSEHPSRIPVLINRSAIAAHANKREDELTYATLAIALADRVAPEYHASTVAYLDACDALVHLQRPDEALEDCLRAVATARKVYGEDATYLAYAETTTGDVLVGLGRYADAAPHYADAATLHERTGTKGDSDYADALRGLGVVKLDEGKALDARALLERALAAAPRPTDASAEDATMVAGIEYALARALWLSGDRGARVTELSGDAARLDRAAGSNADADHVEAWLAARSTR